jgi:hypothetical protein
MDIHEAKTHCKSLVDAMKAENSRCFEVTPRIEVAVLVECSTSDECAWYSPNAWVVSFGSHECLNHEPFPHEIRRSVANFGIIFEAFSDYRAYCDGSEKANSLHSLSHARYELDGQLISNLVQAERV